MWEINQEIISKSIDTFLLPGCTCLGSLRDWKKTEESMDFFQLHFHTFPRSNTYQEGQSESVDILPLPCSTCIGPKTSMLY